MGPAAARGRVRRGVGAARRRPCQPDGAPRLRRRVAPHVPRCDRPARPARRRRPGQGTGYTLTSITAVVLGGTSLLGGRGTFIGTLMGAGLSVQVLNATTFLSLDQKWQYIFQGLLIVAAALIYSQVRRTGRAVRPASEPPTQSHGSRKRSGPCPSPRSSGTSARRSDEANVPDAPSRTRTAAPRDSSAHAGSACASSHAGSTSRRARSRRSRRARCSPRCARLYALAAEFGVTVDEVLFDARRSPTAGDATASGRRRQGRRVSRCSARTDAGDHAQLRRDVGAADVLGRRRRRVHRGDL